MQSSTSPWGLAWALRTRRACVAGLLGLGMTTSSQHRVGAQGDRSATGSVLGDTPRYVPLSDRQL